MGKVVNNVSGEPDIVQIVANNEEDRRPDSLTVRSETQLSTRSVADRLFLR